MGWRVHLHGVGSTHTLGGEYTYMGWGVHLHGVESTHTWGGGSTHT